MVEALANNYTLTRFDIDDGWRCCCCAALVVALNAPNCAGAAQLSAQQRGAIEQQMRTNRQLTWRKVHALIVDVVVALFPLRLPVYVVLWIVDFLPGIARAHRQYRKVMLIEGVTASMRRLRGDVTM